MANKEVNISYHIENQSPLFLTGVSLDSTYGNDVSDEILNMCKDLVLNMTTQEKGPKVVFEGPISNEFTSPLQFDEDKLNSIQTCESAYLIIKGKNGGEESYQTYFVTRSPINFRVAIYPILVKNGLVICSLNPKFGSNYSNLKLYHSNELMVIEKEAFSKLEVSDHPFEALTSNLLPFYKILKKNYGNSSTEYLTKSLENALNYYLWSDEFSKHQHLEKYKSEIIKADQNGSDLSYNSFYMKCVIELYDYNFQLKYFPFSIKKILKTNLPLEGYDANANILINDFGSIYPVAPDNLIGIDPNSLRFSSDKDFFSRESESSYRGLQQDLLNAFNQNEIRFIKRDKVFRIFIETNKAQELLKQTDLNRNLEVLFKLRYQKRNDGKNWAGSFMRGALLSDIYFFAYDFEIVF
jgi:hypothetical protein